MLGFSIVLQTQLWHTSECHLLFNGTKVIFGYWKVYKKKSKKIRKNNYFSCLIVL